MYKATAKQVKQLIEYGKDNKVVTHLVNTGAQPSVSYTAYYQPSQANWSYQIGLTMVDGKLYELVTRFGSVEGGREVIAPTYLTDASYNKVEA